MDMWWQELTFGLGSGRQFAQVLLRVVVAALLRPGYRDETGQYSDGERKITTDYAPEVVDAIAEVIDQLL